MKNEFRIKRISAYLALIFFISGVCSEKYFQKVVWYYIELYFEI